MYIIRVIIPRKLLLCRIYMLIFVITHKNKDRYDNKEDSLRTDGF